MLHIRIDQQEPLATGHIDIDIGQQLRIEQSPVQRTARVVDPEPVAQGIERIAFARVDFLGDCQGIDDAADKLLELGATDPSAV